MLSTYSSPGSLLHLGPHIDFNSLACELGAIDCGNRCCCFFLARKDRTSGALVVDLHILGWAAKLLEVVLQLLVPVLALLLFAEATNPDTNLRAGLCLELEQSTPLALALAFSFASALSSPAATSHQGLENIEQLSFSSK